jgi:hypothetical protein
MVLARIKPRDELEDFVSITQGCHISSHLRARSIALNPNSLSSDTKLRSLSLIDVDDIASCIEILDHSYRDQFGSGSMVNIIAHGCLKTDEVSSTSSFRCAPQNTT